MRRFSIVPSVEYDDTPLETDRPAERQSPPISGDTSDLACRRSPGSIEFSEIGERQFSDRYGR
jgi:hypothetical protein